MKKLLLTISVMLSLAVSTLHAQELFQIFDSNGKAISFKKLERALEQNEVIFFGEIHNNTVAHWLQLRVLTALKNTDSARLSMGMEMFEADDQIILDEYLAGLIQERHFQKEVKLWDNYKSDYRPLIEFCRVHSIPVIASNIPQRYANLVYRKGLGGLSELSDEAQKWMTPLPFEVDFSLPNYAAMAQAMGGHGAHGAGNNLVLAQAIKDATMAHFIAINHRGKSLHINGSYHSMDGEGILWYLKKLLPSARMLTIHTAEQDDIKKMDEALKGKADFIIVIASDAAKSY